MQAAFFSLRCYGVYAACAEIVDRKNKTRFELLTWKYTSQGAARTRQDGRPVFDGLADRTFEPIRRAS
jgi:hypothetical protein